VITFNGLTEAGSSVTSYNESGFTLSTTSDGWAAVTTYGNPAPFLQFFADPAVTVSGGIRVTAAASAFSFRSVDLYSSTTPIPYRITGVRNATTVFVLADTLPNTFGNFRTVINPNATDRIDTLLMVLTNTAAPCCRNPMGLDNIALTR
jgi:hypothetical protein